MKKKRLLVLILQALLVISFSVAFYLYIQKEVEPQKVYIFAKDKEVNTIITKSDIKEITVPASAITKDFSQNPADIVGKYIQVPVLADTYVYKKQLVTKENVNPFDSIDLTEYRKISLPGSVFGTNGGDLKAGDKIDLMFNGTGTYMMEDGNESTFSYTKTFLQNVYVYNVYDELGKEYKANAESSYEKGEEISTDSASSGGEPSIVVLAVPLKFAEEIKARSSAGSITMIGRFPTSENIENAEGYVIGEFGKIITHNANAETSDATLLEDETID